MPSPKLSTLCNLRGSADTKIGAWPALSGVVCAWVACIVPAGSGLLNKRRRRYDIDDADLSCVDHPTNSFVYVLPFRVSAGSLKCFDPAENWWYERPVWFSSRFIAAGRFGWRNECLQPRPAVAVVSTWSRCEANNGLDRHVRVPP